MKILQRYFTASLVRTTSLALLVLVGIFVFLSLIDQLEDAGEGNYGIAQAIIYVILTMPRLVYEIIPIAALIGAMATMAILARNSELDVIRMSGMSKYSLAALLGKSALVIVLFSIFMGEFIAPISEKKAQYQRSSALKEQVIMQTKYGFWAREGNSFINIRNVLPGNKIEEIYIYEFDDQARLRNSIFAQHAEYIDDLWVLEGVEKIIIDGTGVRREEYKKAGWESWLDSDIISLVVVSPEYLTLWSLYEGIRFLKSNSQNAVQYEQAFYGKLIRPFTIIAMIILSIPLVVAKSAPVALGQHVFTGALIGVIFYFCDSASSHIGMVYGIHPSISAAAPTLLLLLILSRLLTTRAAEFTRKQPEVSPKIDRGTRVVPYQKVPREIRRRIRAMTVRRGKTSASNFSSLVWRRLELLNKYAKRAFQAFAGLFSTARRNRNN